VVCTLRSTRATVPTDVWGWVDGDGEVAAVSAYWFAALPSAQELSRVSLDFGLRRADRLLRELIVPEMGRVWFVRQLSWPVAALALRDELRGVANVKASSIAHGLESIGCKLAWTHDADAERILGKRAFGRDGDVVWGFKELRDPKHYVRNTHRQAASRALQTDGGIGLATGARFDVLELSEIGQQLADAFLDQSVGKGGGRLRKQLIEWIRGGEIAVSRTLRHALSPLHPTVEERGIVHARVFGAATPACEKRSRARVAIGAAAEMREMTEVAARLREKGHGTQADEVLAAYAFGSMIDRARDLAAVLSLKVQETRAGLPRSAIGRDAEFKRTAAALQTAAKSFRSKAEVAKFSEPKSNAFVHALESADVVATASLVAKSTPEVFSIADDRVMRGPLFRLVENSESMQDLEAEAAREGDAAESIEPDRTNQTFRLANLHALVRDLEPKAVP